MKFLLIRYICAFLCAFMLLGAFTACDGNETESDSIQGSESFTETDTETSETESVNDNESATVIESADSEDISEDLSESEQDTFFDTETALDTESVTESESASEEESEPDVTSSLKIESGDGYSTVTTPMGLVYTVSGYESVGEDGFSCSEALVFNFNDSFNGYFNRFTIDYVSDSAVKIFVKYMQDDGMLDDCFFLESGKGSFSALVLNFLNKADGCRLEEIRVEPLEKENARFAILGLNVEKVSVPQQKTYYLEGDRYTLGLDLSWGGAISYLLDKECPVASLTNLINRHDAGRLVQQSYYGTGAIEGVFEWGSFNKSDKWPYNPVQGGDRGAVKSRIVDFVVEDNCVYIKAQPMDWGKVGYITPSYMENWYVVEDDFVRVDNRFVDFSGWEHPYNSQELPAFYTVSYLDSFVWYDGNNPWTEDELSYRHELPFWGDSEYADQCSFKLKIDNTETWSAWVNMDDGYGIGLYTPNADRYSAGRHQYNASKSASNNATNYTAPWKQIKLVSFVPLEYSYMMTTGSVEEIRAVFTENKDFTANECLSVNSISNLRPYFEESLEVLDLTREDSTKYILYPNATQVSYDAEESAVKLTTVTHDPYVTIDYLTSPIELYAKDYTCVEIEYMIPVTNGRDNYSAQLFICADTRKNPNESNSLKFSLIKDGQYHTLKINLSDLDYWTGRINTFRFDYFNAQVDGDEFYIRSFKLTNGDLLEGLEKVYFGVAGGIDRISGGNYTQMAFDESFNALRLEVTGNDPSITIDYSVSANEISADEYKTLKITYMVPAGQSKEIFSYALYPCVGEVKSPSSNVLIYKVDQIIADGEFHTIELDMSQYAFWTGKINKIRFDYFNECVAGDVFYIAAIELEK